MMVWLCLGIVVLCAGLVGWEMGYDAASRRRNQ